MCIKYIKYYVSNQGVENDHPSKTVEPGFRQFPGTRQQFRKMNGQKPGRVVMARVG